MSGISTTPEMLERLFDELADRVALAIERRPKKRGVELKLEEFARKRGIGKRAALNEIRKTGTLVRLGKGGEIFVTEFEPASQSSEQPAERSRRRPACIIPLEAA